MKWNLIPKNGMKDLGISFFPLLLCIAVLGTACSSAPKNPVDVFDTRNEAARLIQLGSKALREGGETNARGYYLEAYRLYTATDEAEGRIRAIEGLSRCATPSASGDTTPENSPTKNEAAAAYGNVAAASHVELRGIAELIAKGSGNAKTIALASLIGAKLDISSSDENRSKEALEAARAASAELSNSPLDRAKALRIAGEAAKNIADYNSALAALKEAASIDQKERAFIEYASDRYLAASIHSKIGDFAAAETALMEALENDRRAEHSAGIGSDFLALGIVMEKAGRPVEAIQFYDRAEAVFGAARMDAQATEAAKRRAALE